MTLRRILATCLLSALALVPAQASAQTADTQSLRTIEAQVQQIRGLTAQAEPDLHVLDRDGMHAYLQSQIEQDYLPRERESDQKQLMALGLIKPGDDLLKIQLDLLNDQVVGVYDPEVKSMFVLGDGTAFGATERITYAHEFNHALQDQHFDLQHLAPQHADNNDRSLAAHALIEGDAVLLQTLWATSNLSTDDLLDLVRSSGSGDDVLDRAPAVVRTELLFPYIEGLSFVQQAYHRAADSFAGVDDLFNNPPESTQQVLHPQKYRDHVHPAQVDLPDLASSLGSDWRPVGSGVLGELDTRILLEQYGDRVEAARVAAAWSGDRWQLVEKDGRSAILVKWTWASPTDAANFFSAYGRGLRARFTSAATDEASATRQALTTPVAATDLRVQGQDVVAVIAFDRDSASAIMNAL